MLKSKHPMMSKNLRMVWNGFTARLLARTKLIKPPLYVFCVCSFGEHGGLFLGFLIVPSKGLAIYITITHHTIRYMKRWTALPPMFTKETGMVGDRNDHNIILLNDTTHLSTRLSPTFKYWVVSDVPSLVGPLKITCKGGHFDFELATLKQ